MKEDTPAHVKVLRLSLPYSPAIEPSYQGRSLIMRRDLSLVVDLLGAIEDASEANELMNVLDVVRIPALEIPSV